MSNIKEIERNRPFNVCGVNDNELAFKLTTFGKNSHIGYIFNEVTLAIDNNERTLFSRHHLQIVGNEILERLSLTMTGSGNNMMMLKSCVGWDDNLMIAFKQVIKRGVFQVSFSQCIAIQNT